MPNPTWSERVAEIILGVLPLCYLVFSLACALPHAADADLINDSPQGCIPVSLSRPSLAFILLRRISRLSHCLMELVGKAGCMVDGAMDAVIRAR